MMMYLASRPEILLHEGYPYLVTRLWTSFQKDTSQIRLMP
jgi:hypothetical protein